ncbi:MAG TPA: Holliday junction resolvase RuvX [Bacteroidota bacterium]|nr:Holliday junction resolvase RuvX [Bacteroidota bacterium]
MAKRILGLDYGSQRIGVAISDPLNITARPLTTFQCDDDVFRNLLMLAQEESVEVFVVGMPYNLKGEKGQKAKEVQDFIDKLKEQTGCQVIQWDERFTTVMAQQTLLTMGTKRKDRNQKSGKLDQMAAAILLQSYLDSNQHQKL